ncbi:MAG: hypothetical protein E6K70_13875 [Planctomycetota bacterium]|nr:MAG: hypothetical protein E6K70_13875 [Planctomycetota bacterium]
MCEGWSRAYPGDVEGANIIKIHRRSGKISYLAYPDFDTDPHAALQRCIRLSLRTRALDCYDYGHPLHAKFARLTQQEEKAGLLQTRGQGSSVVSSR